MLRSLHAKNIGLIHEEEVSFGPGLNILTGETGAGKSMIIGSVTVALGTGSFKDYTTTGEDSSLVELVFEGCGENARRMLEEKEISLEDGQIIITRKQQGTRSISRVNGETVPVRFVRELAAELIDLHGQHEHQSLLYPANHLLLLDRFAAKETASLKQEVKTACEAWRKVRKELEEARLNVRDRAKQIDLLSFEIHEIEEAALRPGEDEQLETVYRKLSHGQKIMEAMEEVQNLTDGPEGAQDAVSRALRSLSGISSLDEPLQELYSSLLSIEDLLGDFRRGVSDYLDDFGYDEEVFYETGKRLDLINHLKTKYGKTIEEILSYAETQSGQLEKLLDSDAWLASLEKEEKRIRDVLYKKAADLSKARKARAAVLEKQITEALTDLNFPDARFAIAFEQEEECRMDGFDRVCFEISTNPGMPLRPLQNTASGGELSRIMLAIKSVMADQDEIGSLIFDEIDTGISGRTAQKVAEKMAVIAGNHQVICITHLAQIAAMADTHFEIRKEVSAGETSTHIRELSEKEQVEELTRILGGAKITDAVARTAEEMKKLAEEYKENH